MANGLMPWKEVAERVGLSERQVRRHADKAFHKLRDEFERRGLGREFLIEWMRMREYERAVHEMMRREAGE